MEVLLLGTGAADGWPNPFCHCASCEHVRTLGPDAARATTCALLDGAVLVDPGPDAPLAASRHGTTLSGVRLVLVTHGHWDHLHPPLLMPRHWAGRREVLTIAGPPPAVAAYEDWIAPDDPVELVALRPGDRLSAAGYDVRALPAAHGDLLAGIGLLYDVTGPDGARVFHATDTGPLPEATLAAVEDRAFDVVLLEETCGDRIDHPGDHLDLVTFPVAVAELRRRGAIVDATRLVAVHLTHGNPPPDELARRLAAWGAELLPDGARIVAGARAERPRRPRRVLILGGARSGKSVAAERRLAAEPAVTYVATGPAPHAADPEWAARVAAHRVRRPAGWETVETTAVADLLRRAGGDDPPLLVDCLTTWTAAVLDAAGCWDPAVPAETSDKAAAAGMDELVAAWRDTAAYVVAVANVVGSGVVPATASGRRFRDELGALTTRLAAVSDEVWLVTAGLPQRLR